MIFKPDMRKMLFILSLLSLLMTSCIKEDQTGADLTVGDRIPEFSVMMNDGTEVTGRGLSQGKACIVFFTTKCPDCQKTLPEIQKIYDEYSVEGVSFALISREEVAESIFRYWQESEFTMPYSAQSDRRIYELFAKTRVPRVYICKDGVIKAIFTDQPENPTYDVIKAALESL